MATKKVLSKEDARLFAVISYLTWIGFIVALIWYLNEENVKKNKFAKLHFKQGLTLWVTALILSAISGLLWFIGAFLWPIISIVITAFAVIGIVNAVKDKSEMLPVIGEYERVFKF